MLGAILIISMLTLISLGVNFFLYSKNVELIKGNKYLRSDNKRLREGDFKSNFDRLIRDVEKKSICNCIKCRTKRGEFIEDEELQHYVQKSKEGYESAIARAIELEMYEKAEYYKNLLNELK